MITVGSKTDKQRQLANTDNTKTTTENQSKSFFPEIESECLCIEYAEVEMIRNPLSINLQISNLIFQAVNAFN